MKDLVEFARPGAKPVLIAPEHVTMVEPTLEGGGARIWLVNLDRPVIVDQGLTEVWSRLVHAARLRPDR